MTSSTIITAMVIITSVSAKSDISTLLQKRLNKRSLSFSGIFLGKLFISLRKHPVANI